MTNLTTESETVRKPFRREPGAAPHEILVMTRRAVDGGGGSQGEDEASRVAVKLRARFEGRRGGKSTEDVFSAAAAGFGSRDDEDRTLFDDAAEKCLEREAVQIRRV